MAIIELLFICFVSFFLSNSSEDKQISMKKLRVISTESDYTVYIDAQNAVRLVSDTSNTTVLVFNNEKIVLDFYIAKPYLSSAYLACLDNTGNVLLLESSPVGASGLSANITNVSMVALDKKVAWKTLSYNSFYGGVDLLKYQNSKILITVYDFVGYTGDYRVTYCMSTFELAHDNFVPQKQTEYFIHTDKGLVRQEDSACINQLQIPYVSVAKRQ